MDGRNLGRDQVVGASGVGFNPRPPSWTGATSAYPNIESELTVFQSSPALMDGRNAGHSAAWPEQDRVSILARPHGRAQPSVSLNQLWMSKTFQSSPALMDGRNLLVHPVVHRARFQQRGHRREVPTTDRFQSSPALMDGRNPQNPGLTQPGPIRFNPRPPSWTGATFRTGRNDRRISERFNPRPPSWTGATLRCCVGCLRLRVVSILARPHGRAQRIGSQTSGDMTESFNPRPPSWTGATADRPNPDPKFGCFNPRPPSWTGATCHGIGSNPAFRSGFNPRPPSWTGAT